MFSVLTLISLTLQPGCSDRIGLGLYSHELYVNDDTTNNIRFLADEKMIKIYKQDSKVIDCVSSLEEEEEILFCQAKHYKKKLLK